MSEQQNGIIADITTTIVEQLFLGFSSFSGSSSTKESCIGTVAYPELLALENCGAPRIFILQKKKKKVDLARRNAAWLLSA